MCLEGLCFIILNGNTFCWSLSCRMSYIHTSGDCYKFWRNSGEKNASDQVYKIFQGCSHSYLVDTQIFSFSLELWNCVQWLFCCKWQKDTFKPTFTPLRGTTLWELHHQGFMFQSLNAHFLFWNKTLPPVGISSLKNIPLPPQPVATRLKLSHFYGDRQKMADMQVLSLYILELRWPTSSKNWVAASEDKIYVFSGTPWDRLPQRDIAHVFMLQNVPGYI